MDSKEHRHVRGRSEFRDHQRLQRRRTRRVHAPALADVQRLIPQSDRDERLPADHRALPNRTEAVRGQTGHATELPHERQRGDDLLLED